MEVEEFKLLTEIPDLFSSKNRNVLTMRKYENKQELKAVVSVKIFFHPVFKG